MTEQEWLVCEDPQKMLNWITGREGDGSRDLGLKVSNRKLRLFACACSRLVWDLLTDQRTRRAVEVAEEYSDGRATLRQWQAAREDAVTAGNIGQLDMAVTYLGAPDLEGFFINQDRRPWPEGSGARQAALLRDVVNPFRRVCLCGAGAPQADCPRAARLRTSAVLSIAKTTYDNRDFAILPILADALQDAGCDNEALLRHLRGWGRCPKCMSRYGSGTHANCPGGGWVPLSGPHARGCWALDLVLGKK